MWSEFWKFHSQSQTTAYTIGQDDDGDDDDEMTPLGSTSINVDALKLRGHSPTRSSVHTLSSAEMAPLAVGVQLNHIARETSDVNRLAAFYQEVLGLERMETRNFGVDFNVVWLRLSPLLTLHLIERNPESRLPVGPFSVDGSSVVRDPRDLTRGHHLAFDVPNFDEFVSSLKERGIEMHEQINVQLGTTKQVFFFDPDGNGIEARKWEH